MLAENQLAKNKAAEQIAAELAAKEGTITELTQQAQDLQAALDKTRGMRSNR